MVLKLENVHQNHLEGLLKHRSQGPILSVGHSVGLGWGLRICFFLINLFVYLFIFGCVGSSFLCEGFL